MKKLFTIPAMSCFGVLVFTLVVLNCSNKNYSTNPMGGAPANNEILMQSSSFSPRNLTVTPGTTVTWINKDSYAHDIASGTRDIPDGLFSMDNLAKGASFSYTFKNEGTFQYYCKLHSDMSGTVTVQKGTSSSGGY